MVRRLCSPGPHWWHLSLFINFLIVNGEHVHNMSTTFPYSSVKSSKIHIYIIIYVYIIIYIIINIIIYIIIYIYTLKSQFCWRNMLQCVPLRALRLLRWTSSCWSVAHKRGWCSAHEGSFRSPRRRAIWASWGAPAIGWWENLQESPNNLMVKTCKNPWVSG